MIGPRPKRIAAEHFDDAEAAVARLELIYDTHTAFIRERFAALLRNKRLRGRVRATYPEILIETSTYAKIDSRLAYGHVAGPGVYSATVTQPALFRSYLTEQIKLLLRNHAVSVEIGPSTEPIPLHFAFPEGIALSEAQAAKLKELQKDYGPKLAAVQALPAAVAGVWAPAKRSRSMTCVTPKRSTTATAA